MHTETKQSPCMTIKRHHTVKLITVSTVKYILSHYYGIELTSTVITCTVTSTVITCTCTVTSTVITCTCTVTSTVIHSTVKTNVACSVKIN